MTLRTGYFVAAVFSPNYHWLKAIIQATFAETESSLSGPSLKFGVHEWWKGAVDIEITVLQYDQGVRSVSREVWELYRIGGIWVYLK